MTAASSGNSCGRRVPSNRYANVGDEGANEYQLLAAGPRPSESKVIAKRPQARSSWPMRRVRLSLCITVIRLSQDAQPGAKQIYGGGAVNIIKYVFVRLERCCDTSEPCTEGRLGRA